MEIMLSGNHKEEYILGVKEEIRTLSSNYRVYFEKGSFYLERLGNDNFLQDTGEILHRNAKGMEKKAVKSFAALSNPGTNMFIEKMDDMVFIYNYASQICCDREKVYLIAN